MKYQKPRGTKDILPKDITKWQYTESTVRKVMGYYNFKEIRTPSFENTALFTRGVGQGTDIVSKEMYNFEDKYGNLLTLKPEMTASVIRAYIENSLGVESQVQKLFYITNMFRYEKPQEGRFREHTQFGAEIIGNNSVYSDIELICLARDIYSEFGIINFKVKINSIGNSDDRKKFILKLKEYLSNHINELSDDSKRRFETNPLRILDSKIENDIKVLENAPVLKEFLSDESKERFEKVLSILKTQNINFVIDNKLVRGLDYYNDTTFEFISDSLGAQDAIAGGGRYDGLVEELGSK